MNGNDKQPAAAPEAVMVPIPAESLSEIARELEGRIGVAPSLSNHEEHLMTLIVDAYERVEAAPVAAAPVDLTNWATHYSINPAAIEALQSMLASTSAAPGVDPHAPCTEAVYALARKLLWIAYVWNDHNFDHPYKIARALAQEFGIESFDQANAWLVEQAKLIDASPKGGNRGRYFCDGPEGHFFCDDLKLARDLVNAYDKDDDWTVTDLQATSAEVGS